MKFQQFKRIETSSSLHLLFQVDNRILFVPTPFPHSEVLDLVLRGAKDEEDILQRINGATFFDKALLRETATDMSKVIMTNSGVEMNSHFLQLRGISAVINEVTVKQLAKVVDELSDSVYIPTHFADREYFAEHSEEFVHLGLDCFMNRAGSRLTFIKSSIISDEQLSTVEEMPGALPSVCHIDAMNEHHTVREVRLLSGGFDPVMQKEIAAFCEAFRTAPTPECRIALFTNPEAVSLAQKASAAGILTSTTCEDLAQRPTLTAPNRRI